MATLTTICSHLQTCARPEVKPDRPLEPMGGQEFGERQKLTQRKVSLDLDNSVANQPHGPEPQGDLGRLGQMACEKRVQLGFRQDDLMGTSSGSPRPAAEDVVNLLLSSDAVLGFPRGREDFRLLEHSRSHPGRSDGQPAYHREGRHEGHTP